MSEKLTKVELTNLDKILYPQRGITKAQVVEYYIKVAPKMLPFLVDRPVVLTRFPNGVNEEGFYEKDAPQGTPPWVKTFKRYSETAEREINYIVCNEIDTLIWLANLAALEIHAALSLTDSFNTPRLALFDIDPGTKTSFDDVMNTAVETKEELDTLKLQSYVKTSGKRGLHIVVPLTKKYTFHQTRDFVHQIARKLAEKNPMIVSESNLKAPDKILIDYAQNSHGKTMVSPYSLRATSKATVSTPLQWKDIKQGLNPEELDLFTVVNVKTDPWKKLLENEQNLRA